MNVEYKDGYIEITTETKFYRIDEISDICFICDRIKEILDECKEQNVHRTYAILLDILVSAKRKLIAFHESKCCPYPQCSYPQCDFTKP